MAVEGNPGDYGNARFDFAARLVFSIYMIACNSGVLLSLVAYAGFAQAAAATATPVEGVVIDRFTGQGVPGVRVMFWMPESDILPSQTSVTDFSGVFHVEIPKPGVYHIVADKPGLFVLSPEDLRLDATLPADAPPIKLRYEVDFRRNPQTAPVIPPPQPGAPVEGTVINRITGAAIPGATVTFFTHQATNFEASRYQATTDNSGRFRMDGMDQGKYEVLVEKSGFVVFPKEPVVVRAAGPVEVRYQIEFGRSQRATLTGVVLDSHDRPAAGARVNLIRGPELGFNSEADADGRFAFNQLTPGAYMLRAAPAPKAPNAMPARTEEVATYFPSSIEETGAMRIEISGNAKIEGFWLQTAPVFRVRGVVLDESGRPSRKANVKLAPVAHYLAHVIASLDSYFAAADEGPGTGPEEATTVTDDDGVFEFPSVRTGEWSVAAEAAPVVNPRSGVNMASSGTSSVSIRDHDVMGTLVQMQSSFLQTGSSFFIEQRVGDRGAITSASEGVVYPFWFSGVDGQRGTLKLGVIQRDDTCVPLKGSCTSVFLYNVNGGRYSIAPLPAIMNDDRMADAHVALSGRAGSKLIGQPADLNRNAIVDMRSGGLSLLPDGRETGYSGSVQGIVENGAGAGVVFLPVAGNVLLPAGYAGGVGSLGLLVFCNPDGSFEAPSLARDDYWVAAFSGLDLEGLRDANLLQQLVMKGTKVRVMSGSSTHLTLKPLAWLE
jgi:protocatechuate 3,4-dioxygenase beta subunit